MFPKRLRSSTSHAIFPPSTRGSRNRSSASDAGSSAGAEILERRAGREVRRRRREHVARVERRRDRLEQRLPET